ncbi:MAG: DUF1403 family protein [Pseudomonadota bacterium]
MTYAPTVLDPDVDTIPRLPKWISPGRVETIEDVAFLSGAALSHLHRVLTYQDVPQALLRGRLALRAAEVCLAHMGRSERGGDLRDAVAFVQPGDSPGPMGEMYRGWQRAVERDGSVRAMQRALPGVSEGEIAAWLTVGQGAPVSRVAAVVEACLDARPRDPAIALILGEAALSRALGWSHVVPVLSLGLKRVDLRKTGEALRFACHRAIVAAVPEISRDAAALARRAAHLKAVAPKLRAKGSEAAVDLFLTRDALAPTALASLRSDRARLRFCDRLVELGAVRELTGRDTFRLYGL